MPACVFGAAQLSACGVICGSGNRRRLEPAAEDVLRRTGSDGALRGMAAMVRLRQGGFCTALTCPLLASAGCARLSLAWFVAAVRVSAGAVIGTTTACGRNPNVGGGAPM